MSQGGLGVVSTHSSKPRTRGVAACTLAEQTPRTRGVANLNNDVNMMPMNNALSNHSSVPLPDPFVRLIEQEKITVVRFLIIHVHIALPTLRQMTSRHQCMCARDSGGKLKSKSLSTDTLRT
jgi:hypothetical protein